LSANQDQISTKKTKKKNFFQMVIEKIIFDDFVDLHLRQFFNCEINVKTTFLRWRSYLS
jgi:hypothetical protein